MSPLLDLSIRVLAAAFVGAIIGYEREIRAKGAGMRTHVLVALGSALFMIVSQFGFEGAPGSMRPVSRPAWWAASVSSAAASS